jgi:4-amino-4-deoxy-L-arabinose transferase-like glycosyltransferase
MFPILIFAFFLRIYRLPELLGFWYDQGRDALVIWDFIQNGKFFLIGPMMGNTGIFRGPWYYYLISPFYVIGNGNPLYPSIFLVLLSVIAIYVLYKVALEFGDKKVAVVSSLLASISMYIIGSSRWLSNPTPTLLIGILVIWGVLQFLNKKWWSLPLLSFLVGMGLNFGAATEIYFIPALLFIFYLNKKILPNKKILLASMFIFIFCFLPQILFEIRHDGIMSKALYNFVVNEKTFTLNFLEILFKRINIYYNLLYSKFWLESWLLFLPFFTIFIYKLVLNWKEFIKNKKIQSLIIIFLSPFIGTLFFVSNLGGFYDYYFTAYYLIFILFFVVTLSYKSNNFWIYLLLIVSIFNNIPNYLKEYNINLDSGKLIAFENQIKAIDYIYKNSDNSEFNIDVYVPPVVPYAYDYLFLWQSKIKNDSRMVKDRELENLYTLYEVDIDHPERLEKWLERQEKIGKILKEVWFGGIVVQQRERYAQEF